MEEFMEEFMEDTVEEEQEMFLRNACRKSFEELFDLKISLGPALGYEGVLRSKGIFASMAFNGSYVGIVSIQTINSIAKKLVGKLLQDEEDVDEEMTVDAFGEMVNILAGAHS